MRRYQNPDGTLTALGRRRLNLDKDFSSYAGSKLRLKNTMHPYKKRGLVEDKNGDYIIKEGTSLGRYATSKDKIDERKKYVFVNGTNDEKRYKIFAADNQLDFDVKEGINKYNYTAIKDLKIADSEKVAKYIVDTYGDERIKNLYQVEKKYPESHYIPLSEAWRISDDIEMEVRRFVKNSAHQHADDINKEFAKRGYDGTIDTEDGMRKLAQDFKVSDFPILLNIPINQIKVDLINVGLDPEELKKKAA